MCYKLKDTYIPEGVMAGCPLDVDMKLLMTSADRACLLVIGKGDERLGVTSGDSKRPGSRFSECRQPFGEELLLLWFWNLIPGY